MRAQRGDESVAVECIGHDEVCGGERLRWRFQLFPHLEFESERGLFFLQTLRFHRVLLTTVANQQQSIGSLSFLLVVLVFSGDPSIMDESNWDMTFMTASPGPDVSQWIPPTSAAEAAATATRSPPEQQPPSTPSSPSLTLSNPSAPLPGFSTSAEHQSQPPASSGELDSSSPEDSAPSPPMSGASMPLHSSTLEEIPANHALKTPARLTNRRISSPLNIDASMLDASFAPPAIGDNTYDELEVAIEKNTRRRSFGLALLAPLPPSPTSSDDMEFSPERPSPCGAHVSRTPPLSPQVDPKPKDFAVSSSPAVSVRELARNYEKPPAVKNDSQLMPPPPVSRGPKSSPSPGLLNSFRPAPLRSSPLCSRADTPEGDASKRLPRLDESRLSMDGPPLLDAASFRLSPPKSRPSAMHLFDAAPVHRTPARTPRAPRTPASKADQTIEIAQLLQRTSRPKRLSGTEESFLVGAERLAELSVLADLSDDDTVLPLGLRPKPRAQASRPRVEVDDVDAVSASLADLGTNGLPQVLPRSDSKRSTGLQRSDSTRSVGVTRSNSTRSIGGIIKSDSTRSIGGIKRSDSTRSVGKTASDETRPRATQASSGGVARSNSTRALNSDRPATNRTSRLIAETRERLTAPPSTTRGSRTLPVSTPARGISSRLAPSSSLRNLATMSTPSRPRDRADVPLTMRRRPQPTMQPSSEDKWADAVERDPVRRPPATAPVERRLPSSMSSRRLAAPSTGSASGLGGIPEGRPNGAAGVVRSGSTRSRLSTTDGAERTSASSLSSLPRSGSTGSVSQGSAPSASLSRTSSLSRGASQPSTTRASRTSTATDPVPPARRPPPLASRQLPIAAAPAAARRQSLAPAPRPSLAPPAAKISSAPRAAPPRSAPPRSAPGLARASAPPATHAQPLSDVAPLANAAPRSSIPPPGTEISQAKVGNAQQHVERKAAGAVRSSRPAPGGRSRLSALP